MNNNQDNTISSDFDANVGIVEFSSFVLDITLCDKADEASDPALTESQILHNRIRAWRTGL